MAARPPGWAFAALVAVLAAIVANLIASSRGYAVNWPLGLGTAAVVGAFLGLALLRPKRPADGFSIED